MLAYRFFVIGILFAICGMLLGIFMGIGHEFKFAPVHAHINLVGWATHFLFGLYYRGEPEAQRGALPQIHFWCALVGALLLVVGIYGSVAPNESLGMLAIPGSLVTLVSMILFLIVVARRWGKQG